MKTTTSQNVTHIKVKTNSGDAFFIDALRLYKNDVLNHSYAGQDGGGWCLSTEAEDSQGAWKDYVTGNTCYSSKRFNFR